MKNQVLVVETKDKLRRDIHAVLKAYDLEPLRADSASEARECLAQSAPLAIVCNVAIDGMRTVLEESRRDSTQRPVVVVCAPHEAERVTTDLKPLRPHVMVTPLSRAVIANTIDHMLFAAALQNRLQATTTGVEPPVNQNESDRIDAERFVAVKQLVDKMSTFIGRIASEAQGGLTFFNQMPYFVAIHNRDCQVLATNPTYTQHLGHHVPGNSWDIYSGKLARASSCPVGQTVASGRILKTRAVVKYQSGVKVPVIVHTAPIFNDAGQIELILEVFAGSKEIDRLAEEITTTQQRYQQLFDAAPNYIIVLDRKLRATAVNQGFKSMFGDLTGRNFYDLFPECSAPMRRCPIALTVEDGRPHQGEMVLSTRKGEQHNLMAWTSPVITPAGKLIQVLAIFADITELRKLQDNLSSLGLMMGTLTHSLKGSLTGLDAGLFLIDSGFYRDKPGQIEEGLDVSKLMVERLRKMVYNVLYYAKERKLQTERTSIRHFAGDVAANVEVRIRGAAIQFSTAFAPDLGDFEIDSGLVRAALINILENAMEACLEDTRDLQHRIEFNVRLEGRYVVFDISDNGSGMDENQQRQMFDLFYSSKGHQGTGLGLFITNKVIAKHGGSISVDSEIGQGTTFHIRLPIKS
jgi:PAS domain S-box-containing protein